MSEKDQQQLQQPDTAPPPPPPPADPSVVPARAVATTEQVRQLLEEPAFQENAREEQKRLQIRFATRARLTPAERALRRGRELELHHRQTGNRDSLAEALAMQGRYQEAAEAANNPELRARMIELDTAVNSSDDDCACDSHYDTPTGYLLPNQHVERYGYSLKHRQAVPFIRCRACNGLNARALLRHLSEQQKIRHEALAAAGGGGRSNVVTAAEFFKPGRRKQ